MLRIKVTNLRLSSGNDINLKIDRGSIIAAIQLDLTLYIQTLFLSYGCDNFLRIYSVVSGTPAHCGGDARCND